MTREPGFYWWRRVEDEPWQVVKVHDDEQLLLTGSDWRSRSHGIFGPRVNPPSTDWRDEHPGQFRVQFTPYRGWQGRVEGIPAFDRIEDARRQACAVALRSGLSGRTLVTRCAQREGAYEQVEEIGYEAALKLATELLNETSDARILVTAK